jgi:hypothetical protein
MYNAPEGGFFIGRGRFSQGSTMAFGRTGLTRFAAIVAGMLLAPGVSAQYYDSPGLGQKPVTYHPQDYKPLGIRAGGFMLHPGVQLAAEYTDNAFYNDLDSQSDTIFHVRPYINAQSTWSRHSMNIRLAADIARYRDFGFRDYEDYFMQVSGKLDVKNRSFFTYAADYMNLHEDLNTRDSEQGFEPTRYDLWGASLGYDHTFNRVTLLGQYSWRRLDFDDAIGFDGGVIDNEDRDREGSNILLRAGYLFGTGMQVFASYNFYTVDYDQTLDRNGYARSGDGYQANFGISRTVTGKLDGSIFASYNERSYDDPRLPEASGWAGGGSLSWRATQLTTVTGTISSAIDETTHEFASGYLRTLYMLRVDHELRRYLQLNGFVAYSDNDYDLLPDAPANARTSDQIYRGGVGLNWYINRYMFLAASYDYEKLKSNVPGDDYHVNRVWLTLGLER